MKKEPLVILSEKSKLSLDHPESFRDGIMNCKQRASVTVSTVFKQFLLIALIIVSNVFADEPITVSTFQSISLYWSPSDGSSSRDVLVKYRIENSNVWNKGLPIKVFISELFNVALGG